MKTFIFPAIAVAILLAAPVMAAPTDPAPAATVHFKGDKLAAKAKITLADAEAIALKARPGDVTDKELEKEKGGSGLRYSFDIKANGVTYEVGVDAKTGAVLENGTEGKNPRLTWNGGR